MSGTITPTTKAMIATESILDFGVPPGRAARPTLEGDNIVTWGEATGGTRFIVLSGALWSGRVVSSEESGMTASAVVDTIGDTITTVPPLPSGQLSSGAEGKDRRGCSPRRVSSWDGTRARLGAARAANASSISRAL